MSNIQNDFLLSGALSVPERVKVIPGANRLHPTFAVVVAPRLPEEIAIVTSRVKP